MIYLARHGETRWNQDDLILGRTDIPLNDVGIQQAKVLAEKMADIHLNVIYTSQLQRAFCTGKIVADRHDDCRLEICECLNEMNFGKFEGYSRSNFEYQQAKRQFFKRCEGGESIFDVAVRIYPFIEKLRAKNEDALVVTHNGICRVFANYFRPMENEEFASFCLKNCEVMILNI